MLRLIKVISKKKSNQDKYLSQNDKKMFLKKSNTVNYDSIINEEFKDFKVAHSNIFEKFN